MTRNRWSVLTALLFVAQSAVAQQPSAPQPSVPQPWPRPELAVGQRAPDFSLPGATRYGLVKDRIRLSDLHGKTVILAFFYQARTKG